MRRRCKSPSSFIKFLTDDNIEEEIRIPPAFAKEIKEFSKKWVLKTDLLIKKTWIVKLEQQDSHYYLTKLSWPDFVKNHKIKSGDFLIFRYIGVNADDFSTFEVALFSANGLPKAIIDSPRPISSPETSDSHQEADETLRPSGDSIRRPKRTRQETTCRTSPRLKRQPSKKAKNRDNVLNVEDEISDSGEELNIKKTRQETKHSQKSQGQSSKKAKNRVNVAKGKKLEISDSEEQLVIKRDSLKPRRYKKSLNQPSKKVKSRDHVVKVKEEKISDSEEDFYQKSRSQPSKKAKSRDHVDKVKEEEMGDDDDDSEEELNKKSADKCLPAHIVRRINAKKIKELLLIDETFERKWKVELSPFKDGRIFVGQGWTAFKNEYKLEEGQEYKFTFIENEDNMVLVQKN
ncbi:hypothetical protein M9H77_15722 [Catharanthus roseus]|uniref:Uncharacterized protein n=1 Tax=Catharanthus roseus TaxID=4058 RepID=A0ACC0AZB2_CATRO|nr:hypothetical protein M9H77_15722 [Catharanthus roseus]